MIIDVPRGDAGNGSYVSEADTLTYDDQTTYPFLSGQGGIV